jgi:hypothetical protein
VTGDRLYMRTNPWYIDYHIQAGHEPIMEPLLTAVLLVDHKFQALDRRFIVDNAPHDIMFHLLAKVKEKRHRYFSGHDIDISELAMWRTKGEGHQYI